MKPKIQNLLWQLILSVLAKIEVPLHDKRDINAQSSTDCWVIYEWQNGWQKVYNDHQANVFGLAPPIEEIGRDFFFNHLSIGYFSFPRMEAKKVERKENSFEWQKIDQFRQKSTRFTQQSPTTTVVWTNLESCKKPSYNVRWPELPLNTKKERCFDLRTNENECVCSTKSIYYRVVNFFFFCKHVLFPFGGKNRIILYLFLSLQTTIKTTIQIVA